MLTRLDLRKVARARLKDAQALYLAKRYDGAFYTSGYALECILKASICKTLHWPGFPSTRKEFEKLASFKTHDLNTLLLLAGCERKVKDIPALVAAWTDVTLWEPESRYRPVGWATPQSALRMIQSVESLLKVF